MHVEGLTFTYIDVVQGEVQRVKIHKQQRARQKPLRI